MTPNDDELLIAKDFVEKLDIGKMITIPPKTEIKISCVFSEVKDMAKGEVLMKEEKSLFFKEEECYLIPSGQFAKILAHAKISLEEKGVTDSDGGRKEPEPGDTKIN